MIPACFESRRRNASVTCFVLFCKSPFKTKTTLEVNDKSLKFFLFYFLRDLGLGGVVKKASTTGTAAATAAVHESSSIA